MNVELKSQKAASANRRIGIADCDIHPVRGAARRICIRGSRSFGGSGSRFSARAAASAWRPGPPTRKASPTPRAGTPIRRRAAARAAASPSCRSSISIRTMSCSASSTRSSAARGSRDQDLSAGHVPRRERVADRAEWTSKDSRLKASIVVPNEDGRRRPRKSGIGPGNQDFVQVLLLSAHVEPLGNRRYWPIYEAAAEAGPPRRRARLRLWRHADHQHRLAELLRRGNDRAMRSSLQTGLSSMIIEGVFERFPGLR